MVPAGSRAQFQDAASASTRCRPRPPAAEESVARRAGRLAAPSSVTSTRMLSRSFNVPPGERSRVTVTVPPSSRERLCTIELVKSSLTMSVSGS